MRISSFINPILTHRATQRAALSQPTAATEKTADEAVVRQRFAGMLGLAPERLNGASARTASVPARQIVPGARRESRQQSAAAANTASFSRRSGLVSAPLLTGVPQPTPIFGTPVGWQPPAPVLPVAPPAAPQVLVKDVPGPVIPAGTVVDGMVSAGPMSAGLAPMTGAAPASSGTRFIAVASDANKFGYDPVAMIQDRLAKIGVNSGSLQFERWTDNISNIGGVRVNQYVRAVFPGGGSMDFAAERVLQNPDITALEIREALNYRTS